MESMVTDRIANPEFAVVVRGYDRAQVDEYLGELLAWLTEAERRIAATDEANESLRREVVQLRAAAASLEERAGVPGPQSLTAFSERMGQVMQSAVAAAEALRSEAEREANARRDAVAGEVERMVERAKAEAREILRRARAKERALEENITALAARRSAAVDELGRLHHQLSELLALPEAATGGPATAAATNTTGSTGGTSGTTGGRARSTGGLGAGEPTPPEPAGSGAEPGVAAALPEANDQTQPAASEGTDPAGVTQTMPAVHPGSPPTPEPTMVQYPEPRGGGRRERSR